jgi:hypothetical protein
MPIVGDKTRTPKIIPTWYMAGVRAGKKKICRALRIPITKPLRAKSTAEGSISRVREMVRASLAGSTANPGARM